MDSNNDEPISYQYKANVKDKVKRLEASRGHNASQATKVPKSNKKPENGNVPLGKPPSSESLPVPPRKEKHDTSAPAAVMDVETTQMNSPHLNTLQVDSSINKYNGTNLDSHLDEEDAPVNVKSLLRRFSSGMPLAFRKKPQAQDDFTKVDGKAEPKTVISKNNSNHSSSDQSFVDLEEVKLNKKEKDETVANASYKTTVDNSFLKKSTKQLPPRNIDPSKNITPDDSKIKPTPQEKPASLENTKENVPQEGRRGSFALMTKLMNFPMNLRRGSHSQEREIQIQKSELDKDDKLNDGQVAVEQTPKPKPRVTTTPAIETSMPFETDKDIIIILGPGCAGKSSIVNYLLRQDLSTVFKSKPSEREIIECTIRTKMGQRDEDTSSLVLIDTPGYRNDQMDGALFSTLFAHLDNSSALDARPPKLILIPLKIDYFQNSQLPEVLQNFIKVVAYYHQNMFSGIPQILFAITHSSPLEISNVRLVTDNLGVLMQQHFSNSTYKICFHNMHKNHQKDENGNSVKPFTASCADLLTGLRSLSDFQDLKIHSVFKHVFGPSYPKTLTECFLSKRIPIRSIEHPESIKLYKLLQNIYQNVSIEPTEITTLLEIGWENVDYKLRKKYPSSLISLEQVLQRCQLKNYSELPEEQIKVFELLKHIPQHNPALTDLLTETLQLKIPSCYSALYIGQGFDISTDSITHVTPFLFSGALKTSPVGIIPEEISCKLTEDRDIIFKFFCSVEEYAMERFKDLNIKHVTFPKNGSSVISSTHQRIGYNIVKPNQEPTKTTTATANIEHRIFQMSLSRGENIEFKPQYWETLSSLPELDVKNPETIDCWSEFFKYWGTHVVKAAHGGGSIQVTFRGKILASIFKSLNQNAMLPTDEYETSKVFQWITGDGLDFATMIQAPSMEFLKGYDVDTKFHGGDMKFQQIDLTKLPNDKVSTTREEWLQTLPLNPVILETNLVLVPISYFVRDKSEGFATKMDVAFLHFYSNFITLQGKQSSCSIL